MFRNKPKLIKNVETKSEPYNPKMFPSVQQNTTVTVTIEPEDDGISGCLKGCFSMCMGIGKAAAKA